MLLEYHIIISISVSGTTGACGGTVTQVFL